MDGGQSSKAVVRAMRPEDCEAAGAFSSKMTKWMREKYLKDTYPKEASEFDAKNHSAKMLAEDIKNPDFFGFLAVCGKEICGIAHGRVFGKSGLAKLSWVAVDPEHQHEGIGISLMSAAEGYARSKGCHKLFVYTFPALAPAIKLYMKFGLLPEAYLRKHWWGVDFLVMGKWIGEYKKS